MSVGKWLLAIVWTFVCPGAGQAIAGRPRAAVVWAVATLVALLAVPVTVWGSIASFVLRLASVIDAIVRLRGSEAAARRWSTRTDFASALGIAGLSFTSLFVQGFKIPSSSMYPTLEIGDYVFVEKLTPLVRAPKHGDVIVFTQPCQLDRQYIKRVMATEGDTIEVRCNAVYLNGTRMLEDLVDAQCEYTEHDPYQRETYLRQCSRYRETFGSGSYEVFHDRDRPERDAGRSAGRVYEIDSHDFPQDARVRTCSTVAGMEGAPNPDQAPGTIVQTKPDAHPCDRQMHFVVPPDSLFVMGDHRSNANDSRYWGVVPRSYVIGRVVGVWLPFARIHDL